MAAHAVRLRLDQDRAATLASPLGVLGDGGVDRLHIVASITMPGIPYPAARSAISSIFITVLTEVVLAHWLFSQKKITGRFQTAARFIASWTGPRFEAPSPKKQTAI